MDLTALEALVALTQEGTVADASRRLGISRAAVRRRLDVLETQVGAPLVHRGRGQPVLTPAGEIVLARGQALLKEADAIGAEARATAADATGWLRRVEGRNAGVLPLLRRPRWRGPAQQAGCEASEGGRHRRGVRSLRDHWWRVVAQALIV